MGPVGVVAAMPTELRCLRRAGARKGAPGFMVLASGVGAARAASAARCLLERGATALVSWGCAGGLRRGLRAGSLVLPERVLESGGETYLVHPAWHARLRERVGGGGGVSFGSLVGIPEMLAGSDAKEALGRKTGAVAADMESTGVAQVGREADMPFAVIRAVVDPVEVALPPAAIEALDSAGRVRLSAVAWELARRPWSLLALFRLASGYRSALRTLSWAADIAGADLLAP
jgi:adenosylhomocysteine nucleosidase